MSQNKPNTYSGSNEQAAEDLVPFGKEMRKKHFLFDDEYVNLNQGLHQFRSPKLNT